jgi:ParB family chromosome partitioning protein
MMDDAQTPQATHQLLHQSTGAEWYTPSWLIDPIRTFLDGIDLDPASCAQANRTVRAEHYYNKTDDGLTLPWGGNVFLNPPSIAKGPDRTRLTTWVHTFLAEYNAGHMTQGILLVPATPDRQWFHPLWHHPMCFLWERIKFDAPPGVKAEQPTHPHVLVYVGPAWRRWWFREEFSRYGACVHIDSPHRQFIPEHKAQNKSAG